MLVFQTRTPTGRQGFNYGTKFIRSANVAFLQKSKDKKSHLFRWQFLFIAVVITIS
jgi:hypothetical protein